MQRVDTFTARAVACQFFDDLDTYELILAEESDGGGGRLEIQRPLSPTDDDLDLGQDTYCIVVHTGACHYGGIAAWKVDSTGLNIRLTDEAAQVFGTCQFRVVLPRDRTAEVEAAMRRIVNPI